MEILKDAPFSQAIRIARRSNVYLLTRKVFHATVKQLSLTKSKVLHQISLIGEKMARPVSAFDYIPQIDGLRALAILLVLCWHSSIRASRYTGELASHGQTVQSFFFYLPHGEVGVALFFFVSGFVIAKPFLAGRVTSIRRFYWRRLRRIYPPYIVILLLSFLILGVSGQKPGRANAFYASQIPLRTSLLASLTYVHSLVYDLPSRLNPPIWSLEIEIQFYLLAPLIFWLYLQPAIATRRKLLGCLFTLFLLVAVNTYECFHPFDGRFRLGLVKHLYLFIAGIIASDSWCVDRKVFRWGAAKGDLVFGFGFVLLLAIGIWLTQVDARPANGLSLVADSATLIAVCAVYFGSIHGAIAAKLLGRKWLCLIGTMCYSIYLVHLPLMQALAERFLSRLALHNAFLIWPIWMSILIVASIGAASVYYIIIERPFMTSARGTRRNVNT